MKKPHVIPGANGYTPTAGKQLAAMRAKAEQKDKAKKDNEIAERICRRYLADNPDVVPLTGYEIANPHLYER